MTPEEIYEAENDIAHAAWVVIVLIVVILSAALVAKSIIGG